MAVPEMNMPKRFLAPLSFASVAPTSMSALVVVAGGVFLGGCPEVKEVVEPPPVGQTCELDLNFDTTGAQVLLPGESGSNVLCPAFDQDYYAVDVAAGDILTISLSMPTPLSPVNPAYRILKDDGSVEGAPTPFSGEDPAKSQGEATDFTASHRLDEAGRYYVVVLDARFVEQGQDIDNAYTLTVNLVSDPDANEPNNAPAQATVLPGDATPVTGQIATTGDEDWYAVDVAAGAFLIDVVVSAGTETDVEHEVLLFAADGTTQIVSGPVDDDELVVGSLSRRLRARVEGGARSFVVVRDVTGDASDLDPSAAYSLTVTTVANPDLNETAAGNDTAETATAVTSGTELSAVLASTGDQDVYRIGAPAGTSQNNPGVLIVEMDIDGVDVVDFRPQITVLGIDPEASATTCVASCTLCDENACKNARLQRFVPGGGYRTAYPLRSVDDVLVVVNEFGDDAFQEGAGYTIRFEVIDDPDPGERGDDFLIPNLEFAGFANGGDLRRQFQESKGRARVLTTNYLPVCTGDEVPDIDGNLNCLPIVDVPAPIEGIQEEFTTTVDCSATGTGPKTVVASGRLTYEGDRDFFRVDVPTEGYWGLDFTYSATGAGNTPVELALFVRANNGVIANTLETDQTLDRCLDTVDCPAGSICVDGACWADGNNNPTFSNRRFPEGNECAFVSVVDRGDRPLFLEVTDNGINDFDIDVTYTFSLTVRCGCPTACNASGGIDRCQGVAAP